MSYLFHPPAVAHRDPPTKRLFACFARIGASLRRGVSGQGLVEYALIIVLVAVVVIGILSVVGGSTSDVYVQINCSLDGGTYHQDNGQGNSNRCVGGNTNQGGGNGGGNGHGNH